MNIIDTHVHSNFSFDGENSPREMIERALELGLVALTFTDHIDVSNYYGSEYKQAELMPKGAIKIPQVIKEYSGRISVGYGAELGQFMHAPELSRRLIAEFGFDYIIGCVHEVRGFRDFYYLNYNELDVPELMKLYFEEMLETAQFADIDVLGHLTYPLRYITGDHKIEVDLSNYAEIIHEIFKTLIKRNIGLEINTSGLRKAGYNRAFPDLEYVRLFRELGGKILTIGSDAHRISDLAAGFETAVEIAKAAGFKQIAYFEKHKPIFINL